MSDQLRQIGIDLIDGYSPDQLALQPDLFVIGNVVSRGNPLMEAILDAGLPYISGPQWLAENVLQGRHVLAVAGTHGKTTTTSMLAWILEACGKQPGFLVGGVPQNFDVSARLGAAQTEGAERPLFVIEADEYDTAFFDKRSKFVHYRPRTAILNNLEFDHADIFADLAAIETQFHHLVRTVPASGRLVVNAREDSLARTLARGCWSDAIYFGVRGDTPGLRARGEPHAFDVLKSGTMVGSVAWDLSGEHNQMNALAALAAAEHVGVPMAQACEALSRFQNVKRRMELRGEVNGITVYDDFAHHPTAIRTTVDGLRRKVGDQARILAVFEPRSNTMKLGAVKAQLPWALEEADWSFCHSAGLQWNAAESLQPLGDQVVVSDNLDSLITQILKVAQPGDHILCMSNGGFGGIHGKLLTALKG